MDYSKAHCYNVKVLKHPSTEKAILCKIDEEVIKTSKEEIFVAQTKTLLLIKNNKKIMIW
ncbi:hypothetical protein VT91_18160 [Clostridium sporogenes]|uniref:hypothetical protein n=1 Tax=Clostridium botulinum TaxID=1491 RepID=UPI00072504DF|nr:hypothetical protein [Clostridium botulinum]KRU25574.1 hypothetical protein VT28_31860 [Clostridium sporogenes]KRU27326.1 hypothetical protein WG71_21730 [Clostridium sporogenes]KRU30248.1 hypothetical protein VT91_18160 [Clostridium sporogenes]KRU38432.1 hypothetical protein VT95_32040 [Clostridium sporogenes]MCW6072564.1 hypothetical protein [Clostridium botulinum]